MRRSTIISCTLALWLAGAAQAQEPPDTAAPVTRESAPAPSVPPASPPPSASPAAPGDERPTPTPDAAIGDAPTDAAPRATASSSGSLGEPKKKKKKKRRQVKFKGRVFMRNTIARAEGQSDIGWTNELDLDSARLSARYRDRKHNLRMELEGEMAGRRVAVRDAYIRWQPRSFARLQVGRFKKPISAIALASRWDIPVIERGLLTDLEVGNELTDEADELPVGGRDYGLLVRLRAPHPSKPTLILAVFRSVVHEQLEDSLGEPPLSWSQGFPEDAYARFEIEPRDGIELGATLLWMGRLEVAGTRDTFGHGVVGSVDAALTLGPLSLWLETFVGHTPIHLGITLRAQGFFHAHRGIAAVRLDLPRGPLRYLEPFASASYLDTSSALDEDTAWEARGGMNIGLTKDFRIQLEYEHRRLENFLTGGGSRFMMQAGAVF